MTLKFPQFNIEIIDPIVEVDLNTIGDRALDRLLSVDVLLKTNSAKFGIRAESMSYSETWNDSDIELMVQDWLRQFEI
jgi:hypothetical protein